MNKKFYEAPDFEVVKLNYPAMCNDISSWYEDSEGENDFEL